VSEKIHDTAWLMAYLEKWKKVGAVESGVNFVEFKKKDGLVFDSIIAKLKAADALCEALSGVCKALDDGGFIDCDILRKAIKDYEEAK